MEPDNIRSFALHAMIRLIFTTIHFYSFQGLMWFCNIKNPNDQMKILNLPLRFKNFFTLFELTGKENVRFIMDSQEICFRIL